jgi:hypothetical protein
MGLAAFHVSMKMAWNRAADVDWPSPFLPVVVEGG